MMSDIYLKTLAFKAYREEVLQDSFLEEDFEYDGEDFFYEGIMHSILSDSEVEQMFIKHQGDLTETIRNCLEDCNLLDLLPHIDIDGYCEDTMLQNVLNGYIAVDVHANNNIYTFIVKEL